MRVLVMRIITYLTFGFLVIAMYSSPQLQADTMPPAKVESAEELEAVYANRSDFMKGMGMKMRAFSNFLKRGDGEPLELSSMAAELAENATQIPSLFPVDSGMAQNEESEAKSVIWQEWSDFVAAAEGLVEPAKGAAAAFDSGDPAAIGAAVKALGSEGCGGCHKRFREKKE